MNKTWWWVVAIFGIGGLSCIGNEMTNLGVFFILCAIGVGAAIIIVGAIANSGNVLDEKKYDSKMTFMDYVARGNMLDTNGEDAWISSK
jgi:cell division protein FtsI/penicillin-binding protein 2